jgi:preprotein translocase subunit SecA
MQAQHINPDTGENEMESPPPSRAAMLRPRTMGPAEPGRPETWSKTPRNSPCPCGSGKKFKHCHGAGD